MARPMTADQTLAALDKWGVIVLQYPGWRTRGRPGQFDNVHGEVIHHTGSDIQTDAYLDFLFKVGRPAEGIPGPLCQGATDMDGEYHLGAIGRANHAGVGSSVALKRVIAEDPRNLQGEIHPGPDDKTDGNANYYGNEVRYDGNPGMRPAQYHTALLVSASRCDFHGWGPESVIGHREHTRRKDDPGHCPMDKYRRDLEAVLKAGPKPGKPPVIVPPKPPTGSTSTEVFADMDLSDVVIAASPGQAAVTVRDCLAKQYWLANEHRQGGSFQLLHGNWKMADGTPLATPVGNLSQRLSRIETDTDRIV